MSKYNIDIQLLLNESDVEQKVVWPLLTNDEPDGLGFNETHIQTKANLRKLKIEKRQKTKLYYPDYVVLIEGLPQIVIEAKKPNEDLEEAYREARLYALEINALYQENLNPCKLIVACDGTKLIAGSWDCSTPNFEIEINNWLSTEVDFSGFIELFSFRSIRKATENIRKILRKNVSYKKPTHLLGGKHIQNQQIKNSFGEAISIQYRHLFNPTNEIERTDIVRNAYVKVQKHMSHVTPIDRLIRKKIRPSIHDSIEIADNTKPKEIVSKLKNARDFNNEVLLLIGSVGSGKSTFTTYLKDVAIKEELNSKLVWLRLDLNQAPVNSNEIYSWLKRAICTELQNTLPDYDTEEIDAIKDIFSKYLAAFDKVALKLFALNSDKYNEKLFEKIKELQSDLNIKLESYIDFFVHRQAKELIIILDNCDKRNLEEQLLMFEVASWLKENTKSIVFLPLRETTFDHFKHLKPLDTVVKDLIFRINPPSLEQVIYSRIKYANRLSEKSENNYYFLPNGMKVTYPSSDELSYLKSILKSLFQNRFFKKLMVGIAGRDIRKGIEVFLDFCKSGHINEGDILQMKQSNGDYSLPNHIISRVFIRGNRLYYSDSDTKVKNLFYSDPSDKLPDPFVRVAILNWLKDRNRIKGPSGIIGFHKVSEIIKDLTVLGHSIDRLNSEIKTLIKTSLIISESQDINIIKFDELISINSPGLIHLDLLDNIDYISACAEDIWYKKDTVSSAIAERLAGKSEFPHLSLQNSLLNSTNLIDYLESYSEDYYSVQKDILSDENFSSPLNYKKIKNNIEQFKNSIGIKDFREYKAGIVVVGRIVNIFDYGLICELDGTTQVGLLHVSEFGDDSTKYDIGDLIDVVIGVYQPKHKKYKLRLYNN
ncbi:MAG: hypothetical protein JKX79_11095 [Labilibaculum sp.]|nr:hypothetical protein [Labilibaculum sp.]